MVEFLAGVVALMVLLMIIPLLGSLLEIRMKSIEAADYLLWKRINHGIREPDSILAMEVSERIFSDVGRHVRPTSPELHQAIINYPWRYPDGQEMVNAGSVTVKSLERARDLPDGANTVRNGFSLNSPRMDRVFVSLRLEGTHQIEWLPVGLSMEQKFSGIGDSWSASSPRDVINHVESSHRFFPYPGAQKDVVRSMNSLLDLVFGEVRLRTNLVKPDIVPMDRLEVYVD